MVPAFLNVSFMGLSPELIFNKINKSHRRQRSHQKGSAVLFFVLSVSLAIGLLIYSVSERSQYMFLQLRDFRESSNLRSAVLYCKHKLFNSTLSNVEYVPLLETDIATPYGTVCRYGDFTSELLGQKLIKSVSIEGGYLKASTSSNHSLSPPSNLPLYDRIFKIIYTYSISNTLHDFIEDIEAITVS